MIDKKGPIRGKNKNILNKVAERTGAALKVFLNGRALKKYQVLTDITFLQDGSMDSSRDDSSIDYSHGFFVNSSTYSSRDDSRDGLAKGLNTLIGYKFLAAFLAAFIPVFFMQNILFIALIGAVSAVVGFFVPDLILNYINKRRIKEFNRDLPYIIDLLHIATLSGQNIYNSIKIVSEKYNGSICMALKKFLKEIDFGVSRIDAFKNTVNLTDPVNFRNFLFLLIQAEKYGSSISDLLSLQSKYIRFEVTQRHETVSRRSSIVLLFPLVFLILPAFILLVGGPLIYSIAGSFINFS
jgi:pilus assembly protein TadC